MFDRINLIISNFLNLCFIRLLLEISSFASYSDFKLLMILLIITYDKFYDVTMRMIHI